MTAPDTYSLPQVAALLGISRTLAYRLAKRDGRLCEGVNVVQFGSTYRVSVAQVEALLAVREAS